MNEWLNELETERPTHPRQLAIRQHIERVAWERTRPQRTAWKTALRNEWGIN